jgi:hypothetical protein
MKYSNTVKISDISTDKSYIISDRNDAVDSVDTSAYDICVLIQDTVTLGKIVAEIVK